MLDMHRLITLEDRIVLLKKLHTLYGTDYVHNVKEMKSGWKQFKITLCHERKLKCTEEDIVKEFNNLWPIMNRSWAQYRDIKNKHSLHLIFFNHILSNHTITHPNISELIKIFISVAPNTSPLERSFSKLAKICYKDRNQLTSKNIENIYILSALKTPNINYEAAAKYLEK